METVNATALNSVSTPQSRGTRASVFGGLILVALAVWFFREPLRNDILKEGLLLNNAPTEAAVVQVLDAAKDRQASIRDFWNTGKIVHREIAMRQLAASVAASQQIPANIKAWIIGAVLDPDMNVREAALSILRDHKDPALVGACIAELHDADPQARLLGLDNFRSASADIGVPSVIPLLADSDPLVVAKTLRLLEDW